MLRDLLLEIVDRYLGQFSATPLATIRTKFPHDVDSIEQLLETGVIETLNADSTIAETCRTGDGDLFVPRMLAFEYIGERRRRKQALSTVERLLRLLRDFVRSTNEFEVREDKLARFSRHHDFYVLSHNGWYAGLDVVLAKDFPTIIQSVSRDPILGDNQSRGRSSLIFQVSRAILSFEAIEPIWIREFARRQPSLPTFLRTTKTQTSTEPHLFPPKPAPVTFGFVQDVELRQLAERDYAELQQIKKVGALKSRFVLTGGLIEALLLDALLIDHGATSKTKAGAKEAKRNRSPERWELGSLIDAAVELGIISASAERFSHSVREFRNLVHPGLEWRSNLKIKPEEVEIAERILAIVIRELSQRVTAIQI